MTDDDVKITDLGGKRQPKIVGYMAALYDAMTTAANELSAEDGQSVQIWQGRLIDTCTSVGIPTGSYKKVVDALRTMGCIEIISRGRRGNTPTVFVLRYPPTQELYDEAIVKSGWEGLTTAPSTDTLAAQVRDILKRLGGLNIVEALKNHDERLGKLETAVKELQRQLSQQHKEQQ